MSTFGARLVALVGIVLLASCGLAGVSSREAEVAAANATIAGVLVGYSMEGSRLIADAETRSEAETALEGHRAEWGPAVDAVLELSGAARSGDASGLLPRLCRAWRLARAFVPLPEAAAMCQDGEL